MSRTGVTGLWRGAEDPPLRQWTWGGGIWAILATSIVMGLGVALGLVLALSLLAF